MSKRQDNSDFMSRKQDERLEQLEEKLTALYANAENEIRAEFTDFTEKFAREDQERQAMVEAGELNEEEYLAWRKTQILKSNDYSKAVESMTEMLVNTDIAAMATINGELPAVVAESYDFVQALGFKAAEEGGITAGTFQVYNAETVQILVRDNPDLLPKPSQSTIEQLGGTVDIPEDKKWAKDRINREITQGIVQGQSLPKIAERLQRVTTMDKNAAKRNARTAMTGAENMGRAASAADLKENGIPVQEVWSAAGDDRVRETHRLLDGTYKSEAGYFGEGILTTPLRYAGDPLGDPEEVYNCRCRTGIVLPGIDHSQDDKLYEEFMKQFEESKDEQETTEPEPIATSGSESLPNIKDLEPAEGLTSGEREVVQGEDLTGKWNRRKDEFEFEIDDVVDAQGFNGLPKVVSPEEFDKAVQESSFIAQRTYSAPDQETLDAYRDQLYNGDWYVNCGTGGAQYGQGMYCAADYNGELTDGIKAEMDHYRQLGESRNNERMTDEERVEAARNKLPEDIANNETAIEYLRSLQSGSLSEQAKYYSMLDKETERAVSKALSETPLDRKAVNYTETLTLTPDANIISYDDITVIFNEYRDQYAFDKINAEARSQTWAELGGSNIRDKADYMTIYNIYHKSGATDDEIQRMRDLEERHGITAGQVNERVQAKYNELTKNQVKDIGAYATILGYDAINAEGHGESGSYTVILNRTKVIFKGEG